VHRQSLTIQKTPQNDFLHFPLNVTLQDNMFIINQSDSMTIQRFSLKTQRSEGWSFKCQFLPYGEGIANCYKLNADEICNSKSDVGESEAVGEEASSKITQLTSLVHYNRGFHFGSSMWVICAEYMFFTLLLPHLMF
jgi:hypothetical protein